MAKIGGRRGWLAWPAVVVCFGVVAGLVWLAVPGVPGAIAFAGDLLRTGSAAAATAAPAARAPDLGSTRTTDCRSLYPDRLWSDLTWARGVLLTQGELAPELHAASVTAALAPRPLLSCSWRSERGSLTTTFAEVRADAAAIARAALTSRGYTCSDVPDGVRCATVTAGIDEEIEIRGDRWLATTYDGWHPADYGAATALRVWG